MTTINVRADEDGLKAFEEAEKIQKGEIRAKKYGSVDEMFADLEKER